MIAKIAAVLAVAGLVASSVVAFAPVAGAQTATASATFTRDLTIGSTGADVTALQNWLINKGYAIAAGATGYFGAQTQAALAKYQAAKNISPAAGYFGPITRAAVAADGGSTGGSDDSDDDSDNGGDLSGGEADLTDYEFRAEDGSGDEAEEGVEIATAEFDVEDADARIERMEVTFDAASASYEDRPWQYFDTLYVMVDGDEVGEIDASDRDEWDETSTDDVYTVNFTGLDVNVDEGDTVELTIVADIADSIESTDITNQTFTIYVDDNGIRAVDGEGIQQYIGENSDTVSFGFGAEDNGDLSVKVSDEDPASAILVADDEDESEDYTVFAFDIENDGDADSLITDITLDVATGTATLTNMVRSATLVVDGDEFDGDINYSLGTIDFEDIDLEIASEEEVTFELMVSLKANASAGTLTFSVDAADIDAEGAESGDEADVDGDVDGETHTVALTGIAVEPVSTSQSVTTPGSSASASYGTYTIKFDVTALEDDAFIDDVATSVASTNGVGFVVTGDNFTGTSSAVLTSTADLVGSSTTRFQVSEGETETFTLTVTLDPSAAGTFGVRLDEVNFNDINWDGDSVFTVDSSDEDYRTDPVYVAN
ncbi:MAG TPA: peptidoglycan-binding protein [Candidatus Paceibacterota bacterium]|nr:peptidoglycan-binding protein [Candidatus Paceibacterota bacterium]